MDFPEDACSANIFETNEAKERESKKIPNQIRTLPGMRATARGGSIRRSPELQF